MGILEGTGAILGALGVNIGLIVNVLEEYSVEAAEGIYLIDTIPSELPVEDVVAVIDCIFNDGGAALYPCYKAKNMEPAEAQI